MKLIIDIPEDMYNDAEILIVKDFPEIKKAIANGVPLPEHGYLIDIDALKTEADKKRLKQIFLKMEKEVENNG